VRDIMGACDLPVFVDGDDGYGDVKNVVHTVQSYERMGVSAILIEDQQWPKRCGHMVGKKWCRPRSRGQDPRGLLGAAQQGNLDPGAHRRAGGLRPGRGDAARRATSEPRRRHFHRGAAQPRRAQDHRQSLRHSADLQSADGRALRPILSMDELGELGFNCAVLGLDT